MCTPIPDGFAERVYKQTDGRAPRALPPGGEALGLEGGPIAAASDM
ncbi:hypothetical protein [Kocuria sabuli]